MKEHNKYYWQNRDQRRVAAIEHMDKMAKKHSAAIEESIARSQVYGIGPVTQPMRKSVFRITSDDSVSAIFKHAYGKTAVLNFASYKNPGGGFLTGSRAQEEALCHESTLYNVLKEMNHFYEWNNLNLNKGLYQDRAIYSPDIIFEREGEMVKCDVITCASPNWSAASHRCTLEENEKALADRIRLVLEIAKDNKVNTLILGAYGCGVFQQNPEVVARLFREIAKEVFKNYSIEIIFAIIPALPGQTDNLAAFKKEFGLLK